MCNRGNNNLASEQLCQKIDNLKNIGMNHHVMNNVCGLSCSVEESVCGVINSIACQENALAKVIYSESEKIQKAISANCTVDDLLKVNESVAYTLKCVIELEKILTKKLAISREIIK